MTQQSRLLLSCVFTKFTRSLIPVTREEEAWGLHVSSLTIGPWRDTSLLLTAHWLWLVTWPCLLQVELGNGDGQGNLVSNNYPDCQGWVTDESPQNQEIWGPGHSSTKAIHLFILHSILISLGNLFSSPTCLLFPYILITGIVFQCNPGFHMQTWFSFKHGISVRAPVVNTLSTCHGFSTVCFGQFLEFPVFMSLFIRDLSHYLLTGKRERMFIIPT